MGRVLARFLKLTKALVVTSSEVGGWGALGFKKKKSVTVFSLVKKDK